MEFISWSDEYATGIDVIDAQHREIFGYINRLGAIAADSASRQGSEAAAAAHRKEVHAVMNGLVEYTMMHFQFEETMQEKAGYPFALAHKNVHKMFKKRVDQFLERAEKGEDIAQELTVMLKNWLITHIKRDDQDYVEIVAATMSSTESKSRIGSALKAMFG